MCTDLLNQEFQRVFYKNDFSFGVKIINYYMTFGGTNWGNVGHPGGYTSYDYGAAIDETRGVAREKYGGAKLLANGLTASIDYLTATAQNNSNGAGAYTGNNNVFVTALISDQAKFFVVRHSNYTSTGIDTYTITFPSSQGNITVPQLGGCLSLIGRDSKMYFTDFDICGVSVLYSTGDLFTWKQYGSQRVLIVYSGAGEINELAIANVGSGSLVSGPTATIKTVNNNVVINWFSCATRRIVQLSNGMFIHLVDRNTAYNYWIINPGSVPIVYMESGYLMRSIDINGDTARMVGDLNQTTSIEVWGAGSATTISFNGESLTTLKDPITSALTACVIYNAPTISVPDLQSVGWKVIDGLPEIQSNFNDDNWPQATLTYTNNTSRGPISTAKNLYAGDYGYHTGSLVYRGNFTSDGTETILQISPQGGFAFAYSLWIDDTFLGSYTGSPKEYYYYGTFNLPQLTGGQSYIFTVLIDHMGYNENGNAGADYMKEPRGIMQYILGNNRSTDVITWKLTGNLGGENYVDLDRGPLNEGGMWAERQGYHLPDAPTSGWEDSNGPADGLTTAGVRFYSTTFDLDFPAGYDIPLSVDLNGSLSSTSNYRIQIFVNGYQFGKFISNIGPQTVYPVPEGIWNYQGCVS